MTTLVFFSEEDMRIQSINFLGINQTNRQNQFKNQKYSTSSVPQEKLPYAYNNYNINFGARINRSPEDFYAQKFNIDNMPITVKEYLFEDFEQRQHMPPAQLQRQAFEYLKLADNVQDIKDMYPDEPLFAHLKELKDTKPNTGILLLLKWDAQTSKTPVFKDKNNKDLTTYLLKKVYLEGKTIEEINNDFDNDATAAIKHELGVKDKKYFSHTNIYTLGIRYPKLPYYNSFLATRNDKEYIPPVRKSVTPVSEETKEKLSAAMTKWWAGLDEIERSEQIQKMLNGKELSNSIFSKYQGQIMTIAAAQMGFSEKLSDIFAEKYADKDFIIDFPLFSEQQREIMLVFWNKDPEFRTKYSQALQDTIAEFETAYYNEDKTQLEILMNKALDLKAKVLNKAREKQNIRREMQKLAQNSAPPVNNPTQEQQIDINSKNTVNKLFKKFEQDAMKIFPDSFKMTFIDFLMRNTDQQTKKEIVALSLPEPQKLLNIDEKGLKEIQNKLLDRREELNDAFNRSHILIAKTSDFLINKLLFELTGDPKVFKFERGDATNYISTHNLKQEVLKHHDRLNAEMKKLAATAPAKELDVFCKTDFNKALMTHLQEGFEIYPEYSLELQNMCYALNLDNQKPDNYKEFLRNYNAAIKFYNNPNVVQPAKKVIMEHMILDYINWLAKKEKNTPVSYMAGNSSTNANKINDLDKNYNIDITSLHSLRYAFKQYMHKNETKYWTSEAENKFLDSLETRGYLNQEALSMFFAVHLNRFKAALSNLSMRDKKIALEITKTLNNMIHNDFEAAQPQIANANNAALNHTLYEITGRAETLAASPVDTARFIKNHYLEKKVLSHKDTIEKKYEHYLPVLSQNEIHDFYDTEFYPMVIDILEGGTEYVSIDNQENFKLAQQKVVNSLNSRDQYITDKLTKYLTDKSAFIRIIQDDNIPEDDKYELLEKMVVDFERDVAKSTEPALKF